MKKTLPPCALENVVYIDDDSLTAELFSRKHKTSCLSLNTFINEHEALEYVRNNDVSLLIVDYRMPRMDGIELLELLEAEPHLQHARVYLTSAGRPPPDICNRVSELGASVVLKDSLMHNTLESLAE